MRHGQRLVGVELHAERPGEAASFYAWLLGPGSGRSPASWEPVNLLFEHAVCGIQQLSPDGPPPSWVPVVAVPGLEAAHERALAEGFRTVDLDRRHYIVDQHGIWTRLVDSGRVPLEIDPDALGNTIAELNVPATRTSMETYARIFRLDLVEMVGDVADYHLLLHDDVLALGGAWYDPHIDLSLGARWLVYFDVPDLELTTRRAERGGIRVAVPPTKEDVDMHTVLLDPQGTPFGFCTYFDVEASTQRVRRANGEELFFHEAVRLLVDPRD